MDNILALLRLARKLTQEELAQESGVSLPTIQRIEKGRARPHRSTVILLARALRVETNSLVGALHS